MTSSWIPPAFIFLFGALVALVLKGRVKQAWLLFVPVAGFAYVHYLPTEASFSLSVLQYHVDLLQVDRLSKVFGYIFCIAAFGSFLFALHVKGNVEHISALIYVGSALGVVFSGDFISLYIFWEFMAVASVMLIWARRTKKALDAGYRYVLVHIFGGLILLAGLLLLYYDGNPLTVQALKGKTLATWLILLGFMLNAAVPPLSAWLSDAYPESTATGGVFLSAFTTKTAVYTLIRVFPGWEVLIWLGTLMTLYGIIYAIMENDSRRILAYSIINQVGFMVAGVGIGTEMSLNGASAHAFAHIIYKGLLWMSAGSVLYMTGKTKCTELGGLYKTMPLTLICCCIAAASISSFPLTSGFTTKTMIIHGALDQHLVIIYFLLEVASAGVFLHAGIKFPYFVFFAKDKGVRAADPRPNMQWAMVFFAFICIFLGVYPKPLYHILPYPLVAEEFHAYTFMSVIRMLQLLLFSGLAFFAFLGLLKRTETISLDTDWFYRKGTKLILFVVTGIASLVGRGLEHVFVKTIPLRLSAFCERPVTTFMTMYYRFSGKDAGAIDEFQSRALPEKVSTVPIGIPVFMALLFLAAFAYIFSNIF